MSDAIRIDVFAEDHAHEAFLRAVLKRLAHEKGKRIHIRIRNGRGGHGRVMTELALYQRAIVKEVALTELPDILIVAIDANCKRLNKARNEIEKNLAPQIMGNAVIACPDPHIEKWYLADPVSFYQVVGKQPKAEKTKCERDRYKAILSETIRTAGHPLTLGGIEFAEDLVNAMDFYRAGKHDRSFGAFFDDLNGRIAGL